MREHPITLRAAEPTFDEGLVFARYLDEAADGFFRFLLGRHVANIVATAYTKPEHDFSYQNVTFAERNSVIVGMASGYQAEQHRRCSDQPLKQAAGYRMIRLMAAKILFAPMWRFLDTIRDGDFYLQAIAVQCDQRGEGIGSTLMDFVEEQAIARGSLRLVLDVAGRNGSAQRLYERRGMAVESQWPKRLNIPQFKILRMTKPL